MDLSQRQDDSPRKLPGCRRAKESGSTKKCTRKLVISTASNQSIIRNEVEVVGDEERGGDDAGAAAGIGFLMGVCWGSAAGAILHGAQVTDASIGLA